ncbi:hypothetical protein, partial [Streptomyces sp. NPDC060198]|uniref:hypothetical protein n=1 Tax=Streptomyces sp. NPDC060198 TaxID=3347070 RepID=UPI003666566D
MAASIDEPSSTDEPLSEREIAARARLHAAESALEAAGLRADDLQQRIDTATDPLEETFLRAELARHTTVLADALHEVDLALTETRPTPTDAGPVTRPRMRLDRTPRFTVPSRFDVRRIRHDDDTVTDLTITIGFNGGNSTAAWNKLRQGVEEYYNAPGHRLPGGDLLHITVEPAPPGTTPHLTVDLVGQDTVMDQNNWHHDANPIDYAHELGHQLGLRDEYQDETVPHRPDIKGSLLGNYHEPSPDTLPQAQLRPRHLELLATLIGDTDIQNSNGNGNWKQARNTSTSSARSHTWIDPVSQPLGPADDSTSRPDTDTVAARMLPIPRGLRQDSDDSDAADSDDTDWDAPAPPL